MYIYIYICKGQLRVESIVLLNSKAKVRTRRIQLLPPCSNETYVKLVESGRQENTDAKGSGCDTRLVDKSWPAQALKFTL